jgi:hypothetical protein
MSSKQICSGCLKQIVNKQNLKCTQCKALYDIDCANVTTDRFKVMSNELKLSWSCPQCKCKEPKSDNTNTPIRGATAPVQPSANVTMRAPKSKSRCGSSGDGDNAAVAESDGVRSIIREEIQNALKGMMNELFSIKEKVSSFEQSLTFFNTCFEDLKKRLDEESSLVKELRNANESLEFRVKTLESEFNNRMNTLEQNQRECNIEINGIPENRSENILKTTVAIAQKVDCTLTDGDIVHGTRVAKLKKDSDRPPGQIEY